MRFFWSLQLSINKIHLIKFVSGLIMHKKSDLRHFWKAYQWWSYQIPNHECIKIGSPIFDLVACLIHIQPKVTKDTHKTLQKRPHNFEKKSWKVRDQKQHWRPIQSKITTLLPCLISCEAVAIKTGPWDHLKLAVSVLENSSAHEIINHSPCIFLPICLHIHTCH